MSEHPGGSLPSQLPASAALGRQGWSRPLFEPRRVRRRSRRRSGRSRVPEQGPAGCPALPVRRLDGYVPRANPHLHPARTSTSAPRRARVPPAHSGPFHSRRPRDKWGPQGVPGGAAARGFPSAGQTPQAFLCPPPNLHAALRPPRALGERPSRRPSAPPTPRPSPAADFCWERP